MWHATHELFNDVHEKSTAAMEEGHDVDSDLSEGFWDQLASDDESEISGQPNVVVIDEIEQVQLIERHSRVKAN